MTTDEKDAFSTYMHYSRVLDAESLREFYSDYDFSVLCVTRLVLEEGVSLDADERREVAEADRRLAAAFDPETLRLYAEYFPDVPIRRWWGDVGA